MYQAIGHNKEQHTKMKAGKLDVIEACDWREIPEPIEKS